jgi:hypothetical protein
LIPAAVLDQPSGTARQASSILQVGLVFAEHAAVEPVGKAGSTFARNTVVTVINALVAATPKRPSPPLDQWGVAQVDAGGIRGGEILCVLTLRACRCVTGTHVAVDVAHRRRRSCIDHSGQKCDGERTMLGCQ